MIGKLPCTYGQIIKFACLVGLRPSKVVESVKLFNDNVTGVSAAPTTVDDFTN